MPVFYVITDYFNMSCRTIRSTKHTKINSDDCKYYEKVKKGYLAWKGEADDDFFMEPGTILSRTDSSGAHRLRDELEPCTLAKISAEKSGDGFLLHEVLENHIQTDAKANPIIKEMTTPVIIHDDILGNLTLDKAKNVFLGSAIDRYLFYSVINETGVPTLRHIMEHHESVVKDAVGFATEKLKSKVKEPEWLYLRRVEVKENGVYYLKFKYDDPVWKHTDEFLPQDHMVTVSGTMESGFEKAEPNW